MDPLELRRKNFIPKEDFPAETRARHDLRLRRLRRRARQAARARRPRRGPRASRPRLREQGILPRHRVLDLHRDLRPGAVAGRRAERASACRPASGSRRSCACTRRGAVTVYTGTSPHGQGHETSFAQIVADRLGIDPTQVEVIHGDTATGPQGLGTYGSRSLAVGGEAIARGDRARSSTRPSRSSPTSSRRRPRTSSCATGKFSRRAARRTRA